MLRLLGNSGSWCATSEAHAFPNHSAANPDWVREKLRVLRFRRRSFRLHFSERACGGTTLIHCVLTWYSGSQTGLQGRLRFADPLRPMRDFAPGCHHDAAFVGSFISPECCARCPLFASVWHSATNSTGFCPYHV